MTQVLEYITQNYIWFLVGASVILLAIIGYYADKTNFGQGKNTENKENDKLKIDIDNLGLMDITSDISSKEQNLGVQNTYNNQISNLSNNQNNQSFQIVQPQNSQNNQSFQIVQPQNNQNNGLSDASIINNMGLPIFNNIQPPTLQESLNTSNLSEVKSELVVSSDRNNNNTMAEAISKQFSLDNNAIIFDDETREKENQEAKKREEEFNKFNAEFNSILPKKELINDDLLSEIADLELGKTQKLDLSDLTKFEDIELPRISSTATEEQDIWKF